MPSSSHSIYSMSWLDETRLISGGASCHVSIWETDVTRLMTLARKLAGRKLSDEEKRRFSVQLGF